VPIELAAITDPIWYAVDGVQARLRRRWPGLHADTAQAMAQSLLAQRGPWLLRVRDGVVRIDVQGLIAATPAAPTVLSNGYTWPELATMINSAAAVADVRVIILVIDSPGGTVVGLPLVVRAIQAARIMGRGVVAYIAGIAAGAAVAVAAHCDCVCASAAATIGGVGNIRCLPGAWFPDWKGAYQCGTTRAAGTPPGELLQGAGDAMLRSIAQVRRLSPRRAAELPRLGLVSAEGGEALGLVDAICELVPAIPDSNERTPDDRHEPLDP
jgi:hypothetical protein